MRDLGDFQSWCAAGVEHVATTEAERVPNFDLALQCYRVWASLAGGGIPARQQIDPLQLGPRLLPHVTLIDVIAGGRDYRWRLCGEYAATVIGTRLAGRRISAIEAQLGEAVMFRRALDDVVAGREPLFYVLRHRTIQAAAKRSYGVLLPLSGSIGAGRRRNAPVGHVLGAFDWTSGQ